MDLVNEYGFDVRWARRVSSRSGSGSTRRSWPRRPPEGWEYIGTYATIVSSEKEAGGLRQFWRHHSDAAIWGE
jgi:hypothetical protein